jgi:hypothetical protein
MGHLPETLTRESLAASLIERLFTSVYQDIIDPRCRARMALDDEAILNLPPVLFASQDGVQHDHPDDNASETTLKSDSSSGAGESESETLMSRADVA